MYKILQIKLLFNWTRIIMFLYITNLFLYNPTLCTDITTIAQFEKLYDTKEPEKVEDSLWEPISRRVYDYIVGIRVDDYVIPKTVRDMPDHPSNANNKSLPELPLPNQKVINNEPNDNTTYEPLLDSLEDLKRISFLENNMLHVIKSLEFVYPNVDIKAIPDGSIKNIVYHTLTKYGDNAEWLSKTEDQLHDDNSEVNLRIGIIINIVNDPNNEVTFLEKKILCHLATCMTVLNSATLLKVSSEKLIDTNLYTDTYLRFASNISSL